MPALAMQTGHVSLRVVERTETDRPCLDCGLEFPHISGFLVGADGPHPAYFASTHTPSGGAARLDVTLGTWGAGGPE